MPIVNGDPRLAKIKSVNDLAEEAKALLDAEKEIPDPFITPLASRVQRSFEAASLHKKTFIDKRLDDCHRRRVGYYDAATLSYINQLGGSTIYHNITESKCDSLEAWLADIAQHDKEAPFRLEPTPVPELPAHVKDQILEEVVQRLGDQEEKPSFDQIFDETIEVTKETDRAIRKEALKRAEKHQRLIADQFEEGDFRNATAAFLADLATYPTAFMKTEMVNKMTAKWENGKLVERSVLAPRYRQVSPFDIYPAPHAYSTNDAFCIEVVNIHGAELGRMMKVPAWNEEAIRAVLKEGPQKFDRAGNDERERREDRDPNYNDTDMYQYLEYWGPMQGKWLIQEGVADVNDPERYYEVMACLMNRKHIVCARLNPNPLQGRPWVYTSYKKVPGSIWGRALPEVMAHAQDGVLPVMRSLLNNLSVSSGPIIGLDVDATDPATIVDIKEKGLSSHDVFFWRSSLAQNSQPPLQFWQAKSNVRELIGVAEYYENQADVVTKVPRFEQGDSDIGEAGRTARGLAMLKDAASRGMRKIVRHWDEDIIFPLVTKAYLHNSKTSNDQSIMGDVKIVPRGTLGKMVDDEKHQLRLEFLETLNGPGGQVVDIQGIAAIMREEAKALDIDQDVIPDNDTIKQRIEEQAIAEQQALQQEQEQEREIELEKLELEAKRIEETERSNKEQEKTALVAAKSKPKPAKAKK